MSTAHAQGVEPVTKEADSTAVEKKAEKKSERIQVTGSRIKRTDVEGVSSVIQIDSEAIQKSGVSSVSELMQNLSVSIDGSYSSYSVEDKRGTVMNVNLRGLGPENTLVLLDGRRLPDEGGEGVVDLSVIPMAAVERIEVLKDSASAIYGSDATGGVINIITKKDFEGSAVFARGSKPSAGDGGVGTQFSYMSGVTKDNFRNLTVLGYQHTEPTFYRDREWTEKGLSIYAFPANLQTKGLPLQAHPNCADNPDKLTEEGRTLCAYNYGQTSAFSSEFTQISILNNFEYRINDSVSLFTSLRANRNTNSWNQAPNAGEFTIPQAIAASRVNELKLNQLGLTTVEGDVDVYYRGVPWGLRRFEEENTVIGGNVGIRGELGGSWEWQAVAGRSEGKKDQVNPTGFMLKSELVNAVATGEFNPFETNLADPSLANVVNRASYQPFVITETQMITYDLNTSGELFDMPGGTAALAVGVNRIEQDYKKTIDSQSENNNVFGVVNDQGDQGDRQVNAVYAELSLPVVKELELQAAVRHDQYSDFGGTTNPKFGFKYRPVDRVLFRGSAATGFKAPTLRQIYKGKSVGLDNLKDTILYAGQADIPTTTEVEIETAGNKDLQEETSLSYSFGVVADPFEGFSVGADFWYIKINDIVQDMDAQRVVDSIATGRTYDGVQVIRAGNTPDGRLERLVIPTMNLGESENTGVDTSAEYRFRAGATRASIGSEYSRKFYSRVVPFPGQPQEDVLGERGKPAWRMVNTGNVAVGNQSFLLRNNIIAKQTSALDPELDIGSFTTYDVQYAWSHPWNGSIAVGALNVFDTDFPRDNSERAGDDTRVKELYSPDGRVLYVNLNQVF
ncbi:MAG TPA: TonB-dependent receptor [Oligoflexus sp.]|uniref:TonB-dependent receptor plug domain-containing protein n=1 Tax=Oligoflexus sp. TaxID=1971216 RepID=UPI002D7E1628|nr:TonB-dependent receptor [Oligoflexus sp.]HET9239686.1 TonB-dependent receptor [Oligoflexus sp.]